MLLVRASLPLTPAWEREAPVVLVPSYEAVLLRDKGWKEMYSQEALWQLDRAMDPWWPGQLRSFVAAIDLHGSMSDTPDSRLLDIVRLAIENGSLVGLRKIDGAAKPLDETEERRRLIKKIDQLTRNKLNYAGRQYGLVVDIELAIVPGRNSYEVVSQADARRVLDGLAKQAGTSEELATLLGQASAKLTADWRRPFTEPDGLILLRRIIERAVAKRNDEPAITPSQMRNLLPIHWIEFCVRDACGRPISNARYTLSLPDGSGCAGNLDGQGKVRREQQPSGIGRLALADIDEATWGKGEVDANKPVDLTVATTEIDAGTTVSFEIYRLYRERSEDVVAKLTGSIDDLGRANVVWQPDSVEDPEDDFIFKAIVDGIWKKSAPMTVVREAAVCAWGSPVAQIGDEVTLRTQLRGIKDGENANFTIFQKFWCGLSDPDIDEIDATVTDGVAEATWAIPEPAEPPPRGDDGRRDFFFVVEAGGIFATSDLLAVVPPEAEEASEDEEPGDAAESTETDDDIDVIVGDVDSEEPSEPDDDGDVADSNEPDDGLAHDPHTYEPGEPYDEGDTDDSSGPDDDGEDVSGEPESDTDDDTADTDEPNGAEEKS